MIRVYTKTRHIQKITTFLLNQGLPYDITTLQLPPSRDSFTLGVSYCWPRLITPPLLYAPPKGFVNYHPAPLPRYKGPTELAQAVENREINWGVTAHWMNEEYDSGEIIRLLPIPLHEPPTDTTELGAISHYFLFQLFKETIGDLYHR